MKVIIDIDDKLYKIIKNPKQIPTMYHAGKIWNALKNGTPLPKGYGRLGDLDKLEKDMKNMIIFNVNDCVELVNCADTIIKADKEE